MKKLLPISLMILITSCDSSSAYKEEQNKYNFQWRNIDQSDSFIGIDTNYVSIKSHEYHKVNKLDDLFIYNISIELLQNFNRVKDGNKRSTKIKRVFKKCDDKLEYFGSITRRNCIKGTGIDDNSIYESASIVDYDHNLVIDVSYKEKNNSLYTFNTIVNKNVGLGWINTNFSYDINTKIGSVKVGFSNGETMICDNYMPNSIHTCEYRGVKREVPPIISGDIFDYLDYRANEKFVDVTARFDQDVVELYLNYLQGSGLY